MISTNLHIPSVGFKYSLNWLLLPNSSSSRVSPSPYLTLAIGTEKGLKCWAKRVHLLPGQSPERYKQRLGRHKEQCMKFRDQIMKLGGSKPGKELLTYLLGRELSLQQIVQKFDGTYERVRVKPSQLTISITWSK